MEEKTIELYNGEVKLQFNEAKHLYKVKVGDKPWKRAYGTTSVLRVINKPALMYWAVNMAVGSIKKSWKPGQAYDEIEIQEALKEAKSAHRKASSKAADTGTMVHKWVEDWIHAKKQGEQEPALPVNDKIRKTIKQFLQWVEENNVEFLLSEEIVYSKKFNTAGTLDFTIKIDGHLPKADYNGDIQKVKVKGLYIGDTKTSSGIYPEMGYQLSAYQEFRNEEYPDEDYKGRIILRFGKDGTFEPRLLHTEHERDFDCFVGAHKIFSWAEDQKDLARSNEII